MVKKSSGKMKKNRSVVFVIAGIAVFVCFIFLLANFCWNGKPLWKNLTPSAEKTIQKETKKVQKVVDSASKDTDKMVKKAVDDTKKALKDTKDSIKDKTSGEHISEEDEKELEKIIEQNIQN